MKVSFFQILQNGGSKTVSKVCVGVKGPSSDFNFSSELQFYPFHFSFFPINPSPHLTKTHKYAQSFSVNSPHHRSVQRFHETRQNPIKNVFVPSSGCRFQPSPFYFHLFLSRYNLNLSTKKKQQRKRLTKPYPLSADYPPLYH